MQIIFVVTSIVYELGEIFHISVTIQKRLRWFRQHLLHILVIPCTFTVVVVFWTIWHIDRELIFPRIIDLFLSSWVNHCIHTFIMIPIIIELLFPKRYRPIKFSTAIKCLLVYLAIYQTLWVWKIEISISTVKHNQFCYRYVTLYFLHGVWLYPIYYILNWPQRIAFTAFQFSLNVIFVKISITLQSINSDVVGSKVKWWVF